MSVIVFGCPNTHQSIWSTSIPTFEMLGLKTKKIDIYCSRWRLYFWGQRGFSEQQTLPKQQQKTFEADSGVQWRWNDHSD